MAFGVSRATKACEELWEKAIYEIPDALPLRLRDDSAVNRDGSRWKKGIVREEGFSNELLM
jgi:hypothetical protein